MSDSMGYLYTISGYAALIGIGYVIYQVSTQKARKRVTAPGKAPKPSQAEPRKEDRKKKQRMENFTSEAQETSKKALKPKAPAPEASNWLSNANDASGDDVDNREFAKQLAKAKEGTKFATKADGAKGREKSVKQSRANKMVHDHEAEEQPSAPSSTTGADADDDRSPITSPEVGPAIAGDVSDMLEATPARPTILRLTDTAEKKQNKKAAKAPAPVETKKQRQNRKKAEAAKAAREEAEQVRKVLEEKQRRTARIAEGRAAKDGSQFMAANKSSAWAEGAPSNKATDAAPAALANGFHEPLDTIDAPAASQPSAASKKEDESWAASLPSEEEQIEMLKDEDEWSTVKTKSSRKAAKNVSSVDSGDEPSQSRPAIQPKQASGATKTSNTTQSFGSFSALRTKDEPADEEEEQEEEWDV